MAEFDLNINGKKYQLDVFPNTPILWMLRDHLNLIDTKCGCGIGQCCACTIQLEGQAIRSCLFPVSSVEKKAITNIEGLSENGDHPVQKAWLDHDVAQCSYCKAEQNMSAAALIKNNSNPSIEEIEATMQGNICRCGTYNRIMAAIRATANSLHLLTLIK